MYVSSLPLCLRIEQGILSLWAVCALCLRKWKMLRTDKKYVWIVIWLHGPELRTRVTILLPIFPRMKSTGTQRTRKIHNNSWFGGPEDHDCIRKKPCVLTFPLSKTFYILRAPDKMAHVFFGENLDQFLNIPIPGNQLIWLNFQHHKITTWVYRWTKLVIWWWMQKFPKNFHASSVIFWHEQIIKINTSTTLKLQLLINPILSLKIYEYLYNYKLSWLKTQWKK